MPSDLASLQACVGANQRESSEPKFLKEEGLNFRGPRALSWACSPVVVLNSGSASEIPGEPGGCPVPRLAQIITWDWGGGRIPLSMAFKALLGIPSLPCWEAFGQPGLLLGPWTCHEFPNPRSTCWSLYQNSSLSSNCTSSGWLFLTSLSKTVPLPLTSRTEVLHTVYFLPSTRVIWNYLLVCHLPGVSPLPTRISAPWRQHLAFLFITGVRHSAWHNTYI